MAFKAVKTQAELEAALVAREAYIELAAAVRFSVTVPAGFVPILKGIAGAVLELWGGRLEARENSQVTARGNSQVTAWENSQVTAWENSQVTAWENSQVTARGNSQVTARGNSQVTARGNSQVTAWENSQVTAWDAAGLSLFGQFVKAKASALVSVHLNRGAKCTGGHQIKVPAVKTAKQWCEWYGAEIVGTDVLLYKALDSKFKSPHGANYSPGTETVALDWDGGKVECGKGLHFSPHPGSAQGFNGNATKYVGCLVPLDSIAVHQDAEYPHKVKAERCWNWFECDLFAKQIGEKFDRPTPTKTPAKKKQGKQS